MNTQIIARPAVAVKTQTPAATPSAFEFAVDADYATGKRLYWQGYADSRCINRAQMEGWFDAAAEDDRGRAAYLKAMQLAEGDGERVNWRDVDDILDVRYNAYGDVVR